MELIKCWTRSSCVDKNYYLLHKLSQITSSNSQMIFQKVNRRSNKFIAVTKQYFPCSVPDVSIYKVVLLKSLVVVVLRMDIIST